MTLISCQHAPNVRLSTRLCAYLTLTTFLGFFVIESLLWTLPIVSRILVPQLNPHIQFPLADQAVTLRALFVNQGMYNLMAAAAGVTGIVAIQQGRRDVGRAFVGYTFVFGLVASVTLLASTNAYALGALQAAFPLVGLALLCREDGSLNKS